MHSPWIYHGLISVSAWLFKDFVTYHVRWNGFEVLHPRVHLEQIYKRGCKGYELTGTYDYFDFRLFRDNRDVDNNRDCALSSMRRRGANFKMDFKRITNKEYNVYFFLHYIRHSS